MDRSSIFAAALAASTAALPMPAHAGQPAGWYGDADESGASLYYGTPQSSDLRIWFRCDSGSAVLDFSYEFEPEGAADGAAFPVVLRAGGIEVLVDTVGMRLEMDDLFVLEGRTVLEDRLAAVLTSTGTLQVVANGEAADFPLDGAAHAASPLLATCRPA